MSLYVQSIYTTGLTLYAIIHNLSTNQVWRTDTNVWEAYNSAHWTSYALALAEQASSGYYSAAYPAGITNTLTSEAIYVQAGGSPALSDAPSIASLQSQGVNANGIGFNALAAGNLAQSAGSMMQGSVAAGTLQAASFTTGLTDVAANVYQGRIIVFTSGALIRQVGNIIAYSPTGGLITVGGPFTSAPSAADTFIIV